MAKFQQNYNKSSDKQIQHSKAIIEPGCFVFLLKKAYGRHNEIYKLAPATEGRLRVV